MSTATKIKLVTCTKHQGLTLTYDPLAQGSLAPCPLCRLIDTILTLDTTDVFFNSAAKVIDELQYILHLHGLIPPPSGSWHP